MRPIDTIASYPHRNRGYLRYLSHFLTDSQSSGCILPVTRCIYPNTPKAAPSLFPMLNTRSKAKALRNQPRTGQSDASSQAQMNQVIATDKSPTLRFENRRIPFSSPFVKTNSFMKNVLARVNNPISAVHTQTTTATTSTEIPAFVEPTQSPIEITTTFIDAQSIKQKTPSPRKPSPTSTSTQESIPVTANQEPNSSVPPAVSTESSTVTRSHRPHTGPTETS